MTAFQSPEARIEQLEMQVEQLEGKLDRIKAWCQAYPLNVFPEPDWKEVKEKLGSQLLTEVSGSNMRHVVMGIQRIIDQEE